MSVSSFLYNKAVEDIWADPHKDDQSFFKMIRMTRSNGIRYELNLEFVRYNLPYSDVRYHVFELGSINLTKLGIRNGLLGWVRCDTLSAVEKMQINVFSQGRFCDISTCYIKRLQNKNILIAVEYEPNINILSYENDTYIRFYSNELYIDGITTDVPITKGVKYSTNNVGPTLAFMLEVDTLKQTHPNSLLIYMDGLLLPNGIVTHVGLQDGVLLSYLLDPSIIKYDSVSLATLPTFTSTIDSALKTIFSIPNRNQYHYVDDLEVYITGIRESDGRVVGVYFPRLSPAFIRELTNSDWALHSLYLNNRLDDLRDFYDTGNNIIDVKILIYQRGTRYNRLNISDANRITDLRKLPTDLRIQAITGINATLDIWQADNLERSAYNLWKGLTNDVLTTDNLKGVFSRQSGISLLESVYQDNDGVWKLPPLASNGGGELMVFDNDGLNPTFLNYDVLDHGNEPYSDGTGIEIFLPDNTTYVNLDMIKDPNDGSPLEINSNFDIFCYYDRNGILEYASPDIDYVLTRDGTKTLVTWSIDLIRYKRFHRTSEKRVKFNKNITLSDITSGIDIYNGTTIDIDVGLGNSYIWLSGRYMVEGLDYIVKSGSIWLQSNFSWLTGSLTLTVLYHGLPDKTLKHVNGSIWGWVKNGRLTTVNRFPMVINRRTILFVDGKAIIADNDYLDTLIDNTGTPMHSDGAPFAIVDISTYNRMDLLNEVLPGVQVEQTTDDSVINYLGTLYPQVVSTEPNIIPSKYDLVSIFINAIIEDIIDNTINIVSSYLSNESIQSLISHRTDLLLIDATQQGHDLDFVEIHPRWTTDLVEVSINEYNFLNKLNETLLTGQVHGLNLYLTII